MTSPFAPPTTKSRFTIDTTIENAGTFTLNDVTTEGQILLLAEEGLQDIRVEADNVHVRVADVRGRAEQPHGFGVDVLQGGFTLWNRNPNPESTYTATLTQIQIGTPETPVRGSGVFVAGCTDREGKLNGGAFRADLLTTGEVYTDGGIAYGTADKISGAVFVLGGAKVDKVENHGAVATHGQNDMALDLWGEVDTWVAHAPVTTTGPSGIGFVNFGDLNTLEVEAPIVTAGLGARGFNVYDGTVRQARFASITTHGDGAIGLQISKPVGTIEITGDVRTTGGEGLSLVKGVQTKLKAAGVSIKPGGEVEALVIRGAVVTEGDDLYSLEVLEGATVKIMEVADIQARGAGSQPKLEEA